MTKDFRNIGRISTPSSASTSAPASGRFASSAQGPARAALSEQHRKVVVLSLYLAALGCLVFGGWLLMAPQGLFPPEVASMLGISLVVGGVFDVVAVELIQRFWIKQDSGHV